MAAVLEMAVLASGSRGNASLIRPNSGPGVMIDCGLGVKDLTRRLEAVGAGWGAVGAVLLTHTHGDHVTIASLAKMVLERIPLFCHPGHRDQLVRFGPFVRLESLGLVRYFDERPLLVPCGFRVEPIELSHDGGPTFGFRIEGRGRRGGRPAAVGYAADTGIWTDAMADGLSEVDVLGIEYNHDVEMQKRSGRSPYTIARNLGRYGHLSNEQAAELTIEVVRRSGSKAPRHLVLLHISHECNLASLAHHVARTAVRETGRRVAVHAADQDNPSPILPVQAPRLARGTRSASRTASSHPLLF